MPEDWNKRAAEAAAFRWLPGMLGRQRGMGYRVDFVPSGVPQAQDGTPRRALLPDLTDPATQGAILFGLLFPAGWRIGCWSDDKVVLRHMQADIIVKLKDFGSDGEETLAPEALARALELTP